MDIKRVGSSLIFDEGHEAEDLRDPHLSVYEAMGSRGGHRSWMKLKNLKEIIIDYHMQQGDLRR